MILIQIVLISGFIVLLVRFILSPDSYQIRAWKKVIGVLFVSFAILSILLPAGLNRIAHFLGVGRGADLLLYLLTLSFIFVFFAQYVNSKQEQRRFVQLARKVALLETELQDRHGK